MAQWIKVTAATTDELSLISRTNMVEEQYWLPKLSSDLSTCAIVVMHVCTKINKRLKEKIETNPQTAKYAGLKRATYQFALEKTVH